MNRFLHFSILALFFFAMCAGSFAATQVKTLEFMLDQQSGSVSQNSGTYWNTRTIRLALPESGISVQTAWIEVEVYTNNSGDLNNLAIQFPKDTNVIVYAPITYVWDNTGEQGLIAAKADVTSFFSGKTFPIDVNGSVSLVNNPTRNHKMKLFITYTYNDTSSVQMKTIKYPLDTNGTASAAITKQTFSFDFNAKMADFMGVTNAFVQVYGARAPNTITTDGNVTPRIGVNAFSANKFWLKGNGGTDIDIDYLFDVNTTLSANTDTAVDVNVENSASTTEDIFIMGGEVVVDYNANAGAATQTKTVSYFLGQDVQKDRSNTINMNNTVNLPETGITIRALYAKIYGGWSSATAGTLTVDANVGSTAATQKVYNLDTDDGWSGEHIMIDDLNSAMSGLAGKTDTNISINTKYSAAGGVPVGIELYITYDYDKNSTTQLKTVGYFAGMNAVSRSTDYNATASVFVKEASATRKSAWLLIDHFTGSTDTTAGDYNLTSLISASSSLKVSQEADNEDRTGHSLNGDASSVVTAADGNYTISYQFVSSSSDDNVTQSGKLFLTYTFLANPDLTFALSMPSTGCTQGKGSYDAGVTCDRGYFEPTDQTGDSDETKVDAEGQTSAIPFLVYDNQSTTSSDLNIYMDLNATLPEYFRLKVSKIYGGWASICTGNTDTNCVQVDVNASGTTVDFNVLEDLFLICTQGCSVNTDALTLMKFNISRITPAATLTAAQLQMNVTTSADDNDCTFYHLDQNTDWDAADSAADLNAMRKGAMLSVASACFAGTGDKNQSILSIAQASFSAKDLNFSFRLEDPDKNSSAPTSRNTGTSLQTGDSIGIKKVFSSSEGSNPPKLYITYDANSQNIGKATYTAGTQDFNIFVWGDFISAKATYSADRNALSTSKNP